MTGPGVSRIICPATDRWPRYSEADVVALADGRLLLALGRKEGASDFAKGVLVGTYSADGGHTWDDEPHVIRDAFDDVADLMSVSFARTSRGVHLFFLGRGKEAKRDTRVYQIVSADEGRTWGEPQRVTTRDGYHVVNNARVIRTKAGRLVVPAAFVPGDISELYRRQRVYCVLSDDEGRTWQAGEDLVPEDGPLMEPGVAECADGSLYMTIRTMTGFVYEARSRDQGKAWGGLKSTGLAAPEAPSTVVRDPNSDDLWLLWCDRPKGAPWKSRSRQVLAVSKDGGKSWGEPRVIENDQKHSYGYVSFTPVRGQVLLTYYDWEDRGQRGFQMTNLRSRLIPAAWFGGRPTPPVFRTGSAPVIAVEPGADGRIVSINSGVVADGPRWKAWYTQGGLGPGGERMRVRYAESDDRGVMWRRADGGVDFPGEGNAYHASVHEDGGRLVAYVWRRASKGRSGLYRYVSTDDGRTFALDPARPIIAAHNTDAEFKKAAGEGRTSNDAFDVIRTTDGTWEYYAAAIEPARDRRAVIKHDNAAGLVRYIGRATSADGAKWSPVEGVIRPDYAAGDPFDTQFYGMQVFRRGGFYLGLLHVFHVTSQTIVPEWVWSHTGDTWVRTGVPAIGLGDEGAFDSRMILFGSLVESEGELIWLYSGYDWRHNAFRAGEVASAVGRATLRLSELDAWLDALPKP